MVRWTHTRPTVEGWYWYRGPETARFTGSYPAGYCMLEVRAILDNFYTSDVGNLDQPYVTELTGEWQGPIAPEGTEPCG